MKPSWLTEIKEHLARIERGDEVATAVSLSSRQDGECELVLRFRKRESSTEQEIETAFGAGKCR